MRKAICIFAIILGFSGNIVAQAVDGPYVLYHGETVIVYSLKKGEAGVEALVDSFPATARLKHPLPVHIPDHPDWDFTVNLRREIQVQPVEYPAVESKILAVSDIEGEFAGFRKLLLDAGVMDKHYRWTFGKGDLLVAGDLFDRGHEVTQYLWLLYKLEEEAIEKGGYVHVVLGNHEIMNLAGDFRYVDPMYMASARAAGLSYKDFYTANTELGRWLRSKNVIEKVGDVLLLHGGISPEVLKHRSALVSIDSLCRRFYGIPSGMIPEPASLLFGQNSPFWYRGYFEEPRMSETDVDSTLKLYRCRRILVGHDIVDHITSLYHGKVIGLDVDTHLGNSEGLLVKKRKYYVLDKSGSLTVLTD